MFTCVVCVEGREGEVDVDGGVARERAGVAARLPDVFLVARTRVLEPNLRSEVQ